MVEMSRMRQFFYGGFVEGVCDNFAGVMLSCTDRKEHMTENIIHFYSSRSANNLK